MGFISCLIAESPKGGLQGILVDDVSKFCFPDVVAFTRSYQMLFAAYLHYFKVKSDSHTYLASVF